MSFKYVESEISYVLHISDPEKCLGEKIILKILSTHVAKGLGIYALI